jgi:hypothetical protein
LVERAMDLVNGGALVVVGIARCAAWARSPARFAGLSVLALLPAPRTRSGRRAGADRDEPCRLSTISATMAA